LRNYVECPRKYWLGTIKGIQIIKVPVRMLAGRVMSECLDAVHDTDGKVKYQDVVRGYYVKYADPEADPGRVILPELCKVEGFMRAYSNSHLAEDKGITQYEFKWIDPEYPIVHGYLDMARDVDGNGGYGYEFKYSTHDNWGQFVVRGQLGTYFLGTKLERIVLRILKVPAIKPKRGETTEEFTDRVHQEVAGALKSYVVDTNYWRSEFDLDSIKNKYKIIAEEIYGRLDGGEEQFYQTENQSVHFGCEYLAICESGVVSDQLYTKREVES